MIDYNRVKDLFLKMYPDQKLQQKVEKYTKTLKRGWVHSNGSTLGDGFGVKIL